MLARLVRGANASASDVEHFFADVLDHRMRAIPIHNVAHRFKSAHVRTRAKGRAAQHHAPLEIRVRSFAGKHSSVITESRLARA
ncbi:MAG: hypothetical protein M3P38_03135 [Chloroflexota bacterium]|nr:hypothetical protein [Chloroflexota bacterium]